MGSGPHDDQLRLRKVERALLSRVETTDPMENAMSDSGASAADGWTRLFVKSTGILQLDLSVYRDEAFEQLVFSVVGDKHGAKVMDADGTVVLTAVVGKAFLANVEYTNADGVVVARLKTNSVFKKKYMEIALASGVEWIVAKSGGLKQFHTVLESDVPVAKLDLKTLPLKYQYPIDIADGVDPSLAAGLAWVINFSYLRRVAGGAGAAAAT